MVRHDCTRHAYDSLATLRCLATATAIRAMQPARFLSRTQIPKVRKALRIRGKGSQQFVRLHLRAIKKDDRSEFADLVCIKKVFST